MTTEVGNTPEVRVRVERDRSAATIVIPAGFDPKALNIETLVTLARAEGVVVDAPQRTALQRVLGAYLGSLETTEAVFAESTPATPGAGGTVEWEPGFDPSAPPEPTTEAENTDHYTTNSLLQVRAGVTIARLVDSAPGTEGRDVLGNAIPAPRGDDAITQFDAADFEIAEDGAVVSAKAGVLRLRTGACSIDDVMRINGNVDFGTGNIETAGSVVVAGDVKDCFKVRAERDIQVNGLVEAATVVTQGALVLRKGMSGRGSGRFEAAGGAEVGFLDGVEGVVGGDLTLHREAIACRLRIAERLIGPGAAIIGGETTVGGSIDIGILGSAAEVVTTLRVGCLPALEANLKAAKSGVQNAERELNALDEEQRQLEAMSSVLTAQQKERTTEIQFHRMESQAKLTEAVSAVETLGRTIAERARVELRVQRLLHPGVVIVTESQSVSVPRAIKGPVTFGWSDDRCLLIRRGDGAWQDAEASVRSAAA